MFYVGAISNERRYRKQPKKTINFEHLKVQVFIYIYVYYCILHILALNMILQELYNMNLVKLGYISLIGTIG